MAKYLFKRILYGIFCLVVVVAIVMVIIYSMLDRELVFAGDSNYVKQAGNQKEAYKYNKWEQYGYVDYVPYADYLKDLVKSGELDEETRAKAASIGRTEAKDNETAQVYIAKFKEYYTAKGYTIIRLDAKLTGKKLANGGQQQLFAYRDVPVRERVWKYFTGLLTFDNIHKVENIAGERKLTFTLYDPVYGGNKFSPAILGNGTTHKYLLYVDDKFPYIHQNFVRLNLGTSYTVNQGVDVFTTMNASQGSYVKSLITYPTGHTEMSADDLHSATYLEGSLEASLVYADRFTDDYTNVITKKNGLSKVGYSFVIGIIEVVLAYLIGIPLGILMARKKDKLADKIGTCYVVFVLAVPSIAYIFIIKAIGGKLGLPTTFDMESSNKLMYALPIISMTLGSVGGLMKWMRRYMIDQMNADYVKFARSGGLSEKEIFSKHIMKNAVVPIVQGIPGSILGALVGAIVTERVYVVPGAGNLLTTAINKYDNGVIVGVTLFYATLSIVSLIMGDVLMALVDPRISFTTKDR
ncbi:MAG: ABC transporter permease subunit [Lachnospiraceae bacterium]|nr:ABC transporter permease subunit [Lachnospiraceae bacterium]